MGASAKQRFEARGYPEVLGSGQQPIQESLLVPSSGSIQKETKTIHFNAIKEQEKIIKDCNSNVNKAQKYIEKYSKATDNQKKKTIC